MIKFITEDKKEKLTFRMVSFEQFFIGEQGELMQKADNFNANVIAKSDGTPYAGRMHYEVDAPVIKILPRVTRIEF